MTIYEILLILTILDLALGVIVKGRDLYATIRQRPDQNELETMRSA